MPDLLIGSVAKLNRAGTHLNALDNEVKALKHLEPQPYRCVGEVDVERSRYLLRVHIDEPLPVELSLIVGDYIQNLRAALDHMVWEFVLANGRKPRRNAFPIFDHVPTGKSLGAWNTMTAGVSPEALAFIERLQPHNGPHGPRLHPLRVLRDLSNEDKHRVVLTSYGAVERPTGAPTFDLLRVRDVEPVKAGNLRVQVPLQDGDVVMEAPITITGPDPQIKPDGHLPLDIGWGEPPVPLKGLAQIIESVAHIISDGRVLLGGAPLKRQDAPPNDQT